MDRHNYWHRHWHYICLPPLLVITLLLQAPPPVEGFAQGTQIQANFGLYCNRRPSQRFPIHGDDVRCGGLCEPQDDVTNSFTIRLNATSYFSENIQVSIEASPGGNNGFRRNIRGFALIAMTESNETIVGAFSAHPAVLIASCDPISEGDTAFHARADAQRRSLSLTWQPGSRNYGRIRFRAWIVVQHYESYVIDSDYLESEISGSGSYDVDDNYYTFILRVFNISRSAATITDHQHNHNDSASGIQPADNRSRLVDNQRGSVSADNGDDKPGETRGDQTLNNGTSDASQNATAAALSPSSAGNSENTSFSRGSDVNRTVPSSNNFLLQTIDIGGGRTISVRRRTNPVFGDFMNRFTTTTLPSVGSLLTRFADTTANRNATSSATVNAGFNSSRSQTTSSGGSGIIGRFSSTSTRNVNGNNNITRSDIGNGNISVIQTNSSVIRVSVSLSNGQSREITLPTLNSFEDAFERRLMSMAYDISAEDPFHQVKQEVPSLSDLFPRPLPPSSLALSESPTPSSGNPFFQAFGPSQTSSRSPSRPLPTTRIRQPFSDLLSNINSRIDSGTGLQNNNGRNLFPGAGPFSQPGERTRNGFPVNTDFLQRPNPNTEITGTTRDFGTSSGNGGFGFPNNRNGFQQLSANAEFPGSQFTQRFNDGTGSGFSPRGNSFQGFNRNGDVSGRNSGSLFSRSFENSFPNRNTPSRFTPSQGTDFSRARPGFGFPGTGSVFSRFPQTRTSQTTGGTGQFGGFGSDAIGGNGFNQQNPPFGSLQMPNSGNNFRSQQNFLNQRPNFPNNMFTGQSQGNSFFGQQNGMLNRFPPQQGLASSAGQQGGNFRAGAAGFSNTQLGQFNNNPFSFSRTSQNGFPNFAGSQQPGSNFFTGNTGFQSGPGSANQFQGSFPTSSAALLGRNPNNLNSFSSPGLGQNGNVWNQGRGFNPTTIQAGIGGNGRSANPFAGSGRFDGSFAGQNGGLMTSGMFSNRFPSAQFAPG